jgi:hypothetical protein
MVNFFSHNYNKMENKIMCDCGVYITKSQLNNHKKSKKHLDKMEQKIPKQDYEERQEQEQDYEERQEEEEEVKKETKKGNGKGTGKSKEYMDAIRIKAIEKIKQKKQAQIDKENEIRKKAEQYDELVKSLKEKEELEKKKKEEEKLKDMEYKSKEYDKMIKKQQQNQVINNMTHGKIIEDIKEKRLEYLMKYLSNPSQY